ncbi:diguanylate cyclase DgcJ [Pluralibacter gergoviae]|uniref:diguanylate cyclase DgcJ n=1 Tax=Pluralibacter gergoviae TaxID=61647 RepID=UPI003EDF30F2
MGQVLVMKRIKIATQVVIIITSTLLFSGLLYREYLALQSYMAYVAENGKSALFHEQYINQRIAFRLSTLFSRPPEPVAGVSDIRTLCARLEHVNTMYGFNLTGRHSPTLEGTLQTQNADCQSWVHDIGAILAIDDGIFTTSTRYIFSNYGDYIFDNIRYYLDLENSYIYSGRLINIHQHPFPYWEKGDSNRIDLQEFSRGISINTRELADFFHGNSITSHIHIDQILGGKAFSMICPVFNAGKIKGMIVTQINADDLSTAFRTASRPTLWSAMKLYVSDTTSGYGIVFHTPSLSVAPVLNVSQRLTDALTLHISVDIWYFMLSNLWLLALYLATTLLILRYSSYQFRRHATLFYDNVTDALTGLYNRKLLTERLRNKIAALLERKIAITVIAIDCDGLKQINDLQGHHAGDRAIVLLGQAIGRSVRKSDYGIRIGGDEFILILIDADEAKAREVVRRVTDKLLETDGERLVAFSWGEYQMREGDSLEKAFIAADKRLYQQKQAKKASPAPRQQDQ